MIFNESYVTDFSVLLEKTDKEKSKNKLDFKGLSNEMKSKGKGSISIIKKAVYNIYKQKPEDLASDLPSISQLLRLSIVVGIPMTINPLLGIFTLLVDKSITDSTNTKDIDRFIRYYEKQIEKTEKDIDKSKKDDDKKYLKAHLKDLEKGLDNLQSKKYELEDEDVSIVKNLNLKKSDEFNNEAVSQLKYELNQLTESQLDLLLYDNLSEGKIIDKVKKTADMTKKVIGKKEEKMDKWFNDTLKEIQGESRNRNREEIVENSLPRLSKMIKRAIGLGVAWAVNPAIAAISLVTMVVTSKHATEKEKKRVLSELKKELEIVEEKLKDADSNGDRNEKYQLMRLKQKLTTDIDRVSKYI